MKTFALSLIVAMTPGRVIGRNNALPWRLPSDLQRFKEITKEEQVIVMGRRTYESIIARNGALLSKRFHIVLTTRRLPQAPSLVSAASAREALAAIAERGRRACIIGGEQLYRLFLPTVTRAFITTVHAPVAGDAYFPEMRPSDWRCERSLEARKWHPNDEYRTEFHLLTRVSHH